MSTVIALVANPCVVVASLHANVASPNAVLATMQWSPPAQGCSPLSWSLLADPAKARSGSTNTVVIHSLILPCAYGTTKPKW